jgi:glycosyltransferase involved in cell wall biosynthesis
MRQARSLARLAHQNRCATISAFLTEANLVAILAKTFFDRRLRVVANVHDVTTSILASSRKLKNRQRFLLRSLIRLLYARADSVVAVAGGVKSDMVQHFKVPDGKIAVIHNPIDVTRIQVRAVEPVAYPWVSRKESVLAVAVGRLVKLKGFDFLIQAFAQLPKTLDARLIILGEGVERPRLEQMIGQFGLQERAALLGFQDNPWKYMARADVLVLSSLTEGSPNVIGEAMALGLPVLATDCSAGVSDYVQDGQNGLLVPPGDVKALSEGLQRLLSDGSLRQRLAQGARERATAFDIGKAVQTYEAVLVRVMKG